MPSDRFVTPRTISLRRREGSRISSSALRRAVSWPIGYRACSQAPQATPPKMATLVSSDVLTVWRE